MRQRLIAYIVFFLFSITGAFAQLVADFTTTNTSGCIPLLVNFSDLSTGGATSWSWEFGNNNTSTIQNPAVIYTAPGTYTVKLTVKDAANNSAVQTKTAYIRVFGPPVANFSVNKTAACPFTSFSFTDLSAPNANSGSAVTSWQWDFGDGQGDNTPNPTHTYTFSGTFTVKLTVKDANGCSHFKEFPNLVTIYPKPVAKFTPSKPGSCLAPATISFTNQTTGSGNTYAWSFGNGNTSSQTDTSITYTNPGTYPVKLVVVNTNGCTDSITSSIAIGNKKADFNYSPVRGCIDNPVSFNSVTLGNPITYAWSFGAPDTAQSPNTSHTFGAPGTYPVSLIVAFSDGCTDTITKDITIDDIPDVKIGYTPKSACTVPFIITFTNTASDSSVWDFGDGQTSRQRNVVHTYTSKGPFVVTLIGSTLGGCSVTKTDTIDFTPKLNVISSQREFCGATSASVNFSYVPEYTTPSVPLSWAWDFGDGQTSPLKNPSHNYTTEGKFIVKLSITYQGGCVIDGYDTISVFTYPVPNFSANIRDTCVKKTIRFTNTSTNYDSLIWDFGDKIKEYKKVLTPADGNTTHQYRNPTTITELTDTFDVKLTLFNGPCMKDTTIKDYIRIRAPLAFTEPVTLYCDTPALANMIDVSRYKNMRDSVTRLWVFSDPFSSTVAGLPCVVDKKNGINPNVNCNRALDSITSHTYTKFGDYKAYLRTYSQTTKCVDSFEFTIRVRPKYNLGFVESTDTGCAPLTVNFNDTTKVSKKWFWDFGDAGLGDTDIVKSPVYTFRRPGVYTVTLLGEDTAGCIQTITKKIYVRGPLANFGVAGKLCPPDTVRFTDLTVKTSRIAKWKWNFGDPTSGTTNDTSGLQNPTHRFSGIGSFVVSLTVTDSENCVHSISRLVNYGPPKPSFTIDKNIICENMMVTLTNTTPGGAANKFVWRFGDGDTSVLTNPTHIYPDTGTFDVKLIAKRNSDGCSDSLSTEKVNVVRPSVDFTADNTNAFCPPFTVHFDDIVTPDIISWQWDFGDSSYSTLPNPIHTYNKPGKYTVSLRCNSAGGCADSIIYTDYIRVGGPVGTFVFDPKNGCIPLGTGFKASATGAALYTWDFGDGNVANVTTDTVYHTYTSPGIFKPVLILTDVNNCSIPYPSADSITLLPPSVARFTATDSLVCIGANITFTDNSITPPGVSVASRFWDLSDGATSTASPVTHQYGTSGNHDIMLAIEDTRGCKDTILKQAFVKVSLQPVVTVSADTTLCKGASYQLNATGGSTYTWTPATGLNRTDIFNPLSKPDATTTYSVTVKGSATCAAVTRQVTVFVNPLPAANAGTDVSLCIDDSVQLQASGGVSYLWTPAFGLSDTNIFNPFVKIVNSDTYTVSVTDANGCVNTDSVLVTVVPTPTATVTGPQLVCYGAVITLTAAGGDTYVWSNGNTSASITADIKKDTSFWVIPFDEGCKGISDTIDVAISGDVIEAGFDLPDDTMFTNKPIQLINTSSGAVSYLWNFAVGKIFRNASSADKDPYYTYYQAGEYKIMLVATSDIGCRDTIYKDLVILPNQVFIPTAFTPNGDGKNDLFTFISSAPVEKFTFSVYDRWGEMVFRTSDVNNTAWDGTYMGLPAQQDVYVYLFEGTVNNKQLSLSGNITLLR